MYRSRMLPAEGRLVASRLIDQSDNAAMYKVSSNRAADAALLNNDTSEPESDNDMSISTDSEDSDDEMEAQTSTRSLPTMPSSGVVQGRSLYSEPDLGRKRRLSTSFGKQIPHQTYNEDTQGSKRVKTEEGPLMTEGNIRKNGVLPSEIWHLVLKYCTPKVLGLLQSINKDFNTWLTEPSPSNDSDLPTTGCDSTSANDIWRMSRNRYFKGIPGPLTGLSELRMWQIALGRTCQYCGSSGSQDLGWSSGKWRRGPGAEGVSPIWQFHLRSCGQCLQLNTVKASNSLVTTKSVVNMK
jgi:hypothetical protein